MTPEQARAELARRELAKRQQSSAPEDNENLLQKVVRYGLKDPAIGILNMGREFANLPHKLSGGRIPELSPSDFDFGGALGVENPEPMDKIVQAIGQYAPAMAIPGVGLGKAGQALSKIPGAGKFISKAVSDAIPQALYGASQAPQDNLKAGAEAGGTMVPLSILNQLMGSTSPKVKNIAKLLGFGVTGYLGREGAKTAGMGEIGSDVIGTLMGALGARHMDSTKDRNLRLSKAADNPLATKKMEAANRLGLDYLTPAEAGESQIAATRQGALGKTEEGEYLLHEKIKGREESERRAIGKTLDQIYSDKLNPVVDAAYKGLNPVNLSTDFPLQYKGNKIIEAAEKRVKKSPAYQESLKKYLPENVKLEEWQTDAAPTSLVYWDHVKRALYDMGQEAERKGTGGEANIYNETRRNLVKQMDEQYPEYAEARGLYERKKVREGLEKVFDRKEINGTNFYQALASQNKFDEVLSHLKNAPEAAQNLKDMRLVFKQLLGSRTIKTAKGKEEYGMNQLRNSGVFLESLIDNVFTKGGNDKAAIEFITSKDWQKQLQEINKISDKHMKMVAFAMALSKGVSQAAGQQERKPMELELIGGHR
jgi:hypothetical protein